MTMQFYGAVYCSANMLTHSLTVPGKRKLAEILISSTSDQTHVTLHYTTGIVISSFISAVS